MQTEAVPDDKNEKFIKIIDGFYIRRMDIALCVMRNNNNFYHIQKNLNRGHI